MWNRITLKERGKAAFRRNYWKCVVVALIAVVIVGASLTVRGGTGETHTYDHGFSLRYYSTMTGTAVLCFTVLHIFVFNVLSIGCSKFFLRNAQGNATLDQVLDGFRGSYGRNVLTMFLMKLYVALWSLLLVIPGIVKAYSYMLVPYILADNPDILRGEALRLSEKLMVGNKMGAFLLDLSFIGWHILSALTCGILGVLYVNPYIEATKAELYHALIARPDCEL